MNTDNSHTSQALTLSALNARVRETIDAAFPQSYWLRAETSDVHINQASGHCYLEFIEKDSGEHQIIARARASIWAKTFRLLKPYFEGETGQRFASGLKVLVEVTVHFHELYGFHLTVIDIDPTYTLGDMARRRQEIIRQLQEEGVFTLNKELPFPLLPQRIAVITSATAAGYGDFTHQLTANPAGYPFYLHLFPALMQGERTEESIIAALERIFLHQELFDVVVIIRGGGAQSELSCFDSYLLAANCAQFPLPILTGIGHERDDTIVDLVAHTRLKTPTAVAAFLIGQMDRVANELLDLQQRLCERSTQQLAEHTNRLHQLAHRLPQCATERIAGERLRLQTLSTQLPGRVRNRLAEATRQLLLQEQFVKMSSPDYILQRGYTLTLKDGKIVKRTDGLQVDDRLTIRFADGDIQSVIVNK
ncbi:MAG: exodeoxyribonuclease VII large subunit [Parabacteroides sp.]